MYQKYAIFNEIQNFTQCLKCPAGWSTSGIIDKLPPQKQLGAEFCLACAPGHYSAYSKSVECHMCEYGRYQGAKAQTSCRFCTGGEIPGANRAACIVPGWTIPANCQAGQYIDDSIVDGEVCLVLSHAKR